MCLFRLVLYWPKWRNNATTINNIEFMAQFTVKRIAKLIDATIEGNEDLPIEMLQKIEEASSKGLTFMANEAYESYIYNSKAAAIVVSTSFQPKQPVSVTLLRVKDPYSAFATLLEVFQNKVNDLPERESPQVIHPSASIGEDTRIGAFAYVAEGAVIGKHCVIHPHVYIGSNAKIGDNCILFPGVKIGHDCVVGNRCTIHQNAVIGSDGFGFAPSESGYSKVAQTGNVVLEDDVDVGAQTTIDRATLGSTKIDKGVKLDNLIQIAHNVHIGEHTVMAAQCGVAGSTKIGSFCMFGGQVGIAGHLTIGNKVKVAAQTGISRSIKDEEVIMGSPAINAREYNRAYVIFKQLPNLAQKWNKLVKDQKK